MLADLAQDVRYAFRSLIKNPMFSLIAVVTFAIGIGANVVVFTLVERILLSPLPYNDPDRIVKEAMEILDHPPRTGRVPEYWDGKAADRIADVLAKL